jgi:hypothetical protein
MACGASRDIPVSLGASFHWAGSISGMSAIELRNFTFARVMNCFPIKYTSEIRCGKAYHRFHVLSELLNLSPLSPLLFAPDLYLWRLLISRR